eukprot:m.133181 g.133181  ORF g.133181 m.133181 type:complete len:382 (-) comp14823_c1_seq1:129-1274(-)
MNPDTPFEPQESLWTCIARFAPPSEHEEIRRVIGSALVERAQMLHREVTGLLDIWHEYHHQTLAAEESNRTQKRMLPEPPGMRERLRQEITFYIKSLQEKNARLPSETATVADYVLGNDRPESRASRPRTASAHGGRTVPVRPVTASSGGSARSSSGGSLTERLIDPINESINAFDIDTVAASIRQAFTLECAALDEDAEFLRGCLDDECMYRHATAAASGPPTLTALRECRALLERSYLAAAPATTAAALAPGPVGSAPAPTRDAPRRVLPAPPPTGSPSRSLAAPRMLPEPRGARQAASVTQSLDGPVRAGPTTSGPLADPAAVAFPLSSSSSSSTPMPGSHAAETTTTATAATAAAGQERPTTAARFRQMVFASRGEA